jgi:hypothetical protein
MIAYFLGVPKHNAAITKIYNDNLANKPAGVTNGAFWSTAVLQYARSKAWERQRVQKDPGHNGVPVKVIWNGEIPLDKNKQPICQASPATVGGAGVPRQASPCAPEEPDPQDSDSPSEASSKSAASASSVHSSQTASQASQSQLHQSHQSLFSAAASSLWSSQSAAKASQQSRQSQQASINSVASLSSKTRQSQLSAISTTLRVLRHPHQELLIQLSHLWPAFQRPPSPQRQMVQSPQRLLRRLLKPLV